MRLIAQAKMGYYPTPDIVTKLISGRLTRTTRGSVRILDPCAGVEFQINWTIFF